MMGGWWLKPRLQAPVLGPMYNADAHPPENRRLQSAVL